MKPQSEFTEGAKVQTCHGVGVLTKIKPGNFRNQDYQVSYSSGFQYWYKLTDLTIPEPATIRNAKPKPVRTRYDKAA